MGVDVPQSDVLDLAIGLIFVWFLLSMLVSVVNEAFALVFRLRAKHLWLAMGRLVRPKVAPYARRFLDTAILLPFSKLNKKGFDVRPVARRESSDAPLTRTKPPALSPLAADLQAIYDVLAPRLTDVAVAGRRSKLTSIAGVDFADAIAELAGKVHPGDLLRAAGNAGWTDEDQTSLAQALASFDPSAPVSADEAAGLAVASKTAADLRALHAAAAAMFTGRDIADFFADNPKLAASIRDAYDSAVGDKALAATATVEKW